MGYPDAASTIYPYTYTPASRLQIYIVMHEAQSARVVVNEKS